MTTQTDFNTFAQEFAAPTTPTETATVDQFADFAEDFLGRVALATDLIEYIRTKYPAQADKHMKGAMYLASNIALGDTFKTYYDVIDFYMSTGN